MGNESRQIRSFCGNRSRGQSGRLTTLAAIMLLSLGIAFGGEAQADTIFVTTLQQKISETGGCSLQEAIYSANLDNNIAIDSTNPDHFITTECVAGNGDDRIILPTGAVLQMGSIVDDAYNYMGPTATPIIFTSITIEAHGARLEHLPNGVNFRAFAVGKASINLPDGTTASGNGNLTVKNIHIKGFTAKGGDGGPGGGGGMGAGGAIFVSYPGALVVESSTFEGNVAAGGNGGGGFRQGGGGGGIGGNGSSNDGSTPFEGGAGGGGGGSRGNGGTGEILIGGGGGGTVTNGRDASLGSLPGDPYLGGGWRCGGGLSLTANSFNGTHASCPGGGGGGGGKPSLNDFGSKTGGDGGNGAFGGGGGGGGYTTSSSLGGFGGSGGNGGFGGGGGNCIAHGLFLGFSTDHNGGNGGYGGGGGACLGNDGGRPGFFGGAGGDELNGGGGAGLGGAIFNSGGTVTVRNSTFTANVAVRGEGAEVGAEQKAPNGADAGAAIFSYWGSLTVVHSTISGNESTGPLGGLVFDNRAQGDCGFFDACLGSAPTYFTLLNTIIAHNGGGFNSPRECSILSNDSFFTPTLYVVGSGNLIMQNDTTESPAHFACHGVVATGDPQLGPLQNNQGPTPTMAIPNTSPAFNTADSGNSLPTDQRGQERPQDSPDIGAFELCLDPTDQPCLILAGIADPRTLTIQTSLAAGGTISPAPGTYTVEADTVIVVKAVPNPNYCFLNWTGNVTIPTSLLTTVVMNQEQTVTANFASVVTTTVAKPLLGPGLNHDLVNVGLASSGNCGSATTFQVQVFGDEDDQTPTDSKGTVFSPDAANIAVGTLRLRAERVDSGNGRVYLIVVRGADASGNTGLVCSTVVVPHDASSSSLASVNSQAVAATAYCQANNGAAPPDYFVIGDGPVIGPKQ